MDLDLNRWMQPVELFESMDLDPWIHYRVLCGRSRLWELIGILGRIGVFPMAKSR